MRDDEFKKKLSEVADWAYPIQVTAADLNIPRKQGRPSAEDIIERENQRKFFEENNGVNPTCPLEIKSVKIAAITCEDCGKHCEEGRKVDKKIYGIGRRPHWRERCLNCNKYKNPFTQKFELTVSSVHGKWNSYLNDRERRFKSNIAVDSEKINK